MGTNLQFDFLAVDYHGFFLEIGFPDLLGVTLRETDIVAELFPFAGDFTLTHFDPSVRQFILSFSMLLVNRCFSDSFYVECWYTVAMLFDTSGMGILIFIVSLIVSLTVHEFTHAVVARNLGDDTAYEAGRITLNPLKHVDLYTTVLLPIVTLVLFHAPILIAKPVPINVNRLRYGEFGAALVCTAGPLSNLVLAAIVGLLYRANVLSSAGQIVAIFVALNIDLFLFNMIPIPPLDGSRLLYAFAPEPLQELMDKLESFGFVAVVLIFLALSSLLWPLLSNLSQILFNALV